MKLGPGKRDHTITSGMKIYTLSDFILVTVSLAKGVAKILLFAFIGAKWILRFRAAFYC